MAKPELKGFLVNVVSDEDKMYMLAEIYYGEFAIAVMHTENGDFEVEFSNDSKINYGQDRIDVRLSDFIKTLDRAKVELELFPNGLRKK